MKVVFGDDGAYSIIFGCQHFSACHEVISKSWPWYLTTFERGHSGLYATFKNVVGGISKADILASRPFSSRGRRIYPLIRRTSYVSTDFDHALNVLAYCLLALHRSTRARFLPPPFPLHIHVNTKMIIYSKWTKKEPVWNNCGNHQPCSSLNPKLDKQKTWTSPKAILTLKIHAVCFISDGL